ncbi:putative uncharacterized protein C15orf56 homolog isoform X1 [Trachypithecus francoisi]|uniref:putative uncharacterized protein C15orf56 homolog isoform X1 n=1 Tax=Trachypithecus francoisi TaxID=54180 RepID=UPI00141BD39D|nr:putative uncharacterized protein C15orf56 homolog isoform X1 [Trachypithecus francoisi]
MANVASVPAGVATGWRPGVGNRPAPASPLNSWLRCKRRQPPCGVHGEKGTLGAAPLPGRPLSRRTPTRRGHPARPPGPRSQAPLLRPLGDANAPSRAGARGGRSRSRGAELQMLTPKAPRLAPAGPELRGMGIQEGGRACWEACPRREPPGQPGHPPEEREAQERSKRPWEPGPPSAGGTSARERRGGAVLTAPARPSPPGPGWPQPWGPACGSTARWPPRGNPTRRTSWVPAVCNHLVHWHRRCTLQSRGPTLLCRGAACAHPHILESPRGSPKTRHVG